MNKLFSLLLAFFTIISPACSQGSKKSISDSKAEKFISEVNITPAAEQMEDYLQYLEGKKVGLVVNHTSLVKEIHLTDTLISRGIKVVKIFAPEHGFRGMADAGETVKNDIDVKTGLPIVSLYGKNKKPTAEQIKDIDVLLFDVQDVGVRFYTYISTMHYIMEAAAENGKQVIVLDRPNPNGDYIDGPVLKPEHKSFVGMHPIPIVHGLTVAELAQMINGEKWLENGLQADLKVIKMKHYSHKTSYSLPVKPSPNLPNDRSIQLYPTLGLFEGTNISMGRGTKFPFQVIGYPDPKFGEFTFTPENGVNSAINPPHENKKCYGIDFRNKKSPEAFTLNYLIDFYNLAPDKNSFFNSFFVKLAGTESLKEQIQKGLSEKEIKQSWVPEQNKYKTMRKKYLLYSDFE